MGPETSAEKGPHMNAEPSWPSPPDPGDLSKRVARRRAELGLSAAQVAARAGIPLRYLEYLERYPARPTATALRQLAAALRTTPAALLGAGGEVPPGFGRPAGPPVMEKLTPAECRRLIAPGGVGRIAGRGSAATARSTSASFRSRSPAAASRPADQRTTTSGPPQGAARS